MALSLDHPVKTSTDIAVLGAAGTINVVQLNEYVTLAAGVLAIIWSLIRIGEWINTKPWLRQRNH